MLGLKNLKIQEHKAELMEKIKENDIRESYLRAISNITSNGKVQVTPIKDQDSSITSNLVNSNCLIKVKPYQKKLNKGDFVKIIYYPQSNSQL